MSRLADFLRIDDSAPLPVYAQLAEELRRAIVAGRWAPGEKIPSVRELAVAVGVNPNTVAKVYDLLVDEGVLRVQRGVGVFVAYVPSPAGRLGEFRDRVERLLRDARAAGVSRAEFDRLVSQAARRVYE